MESKFIEWKLSLCASNSWWVDLLDDIFPSAGDIHCDGCTVQRGKHQILGDSLV